MPEPPRTSRTPSFNHVAMSVPAASLDETGREDLLRFYSEVFGWSEMPTLTRDRERLVLRAWRNDQFVFLVAAPAPMLCPRTDHFGFSVGSPAELEEIRDRARRYQELDERVEVVESPVEDFRVVKLHSFYVRYRLPLMVEVQCFEWAKGFGPQSLPEG